MTERRAPIDPWQSVDALTGIGPRLREGLEAQGVYLVMPVNVRVCWEEAWSEWAIGSTSCLSICPRWFHRLCKFRLKPGGGPVLAEVAIELVEKKR